MSDKKDTKSKASGHSGVSLDTPIYLKTGPVRIKPVQNIMFELDSTSKHGPIGSPKIEQINDKAIGLAPLMRGQIKSRDASKASTSSESVSHQAISQTSMKMGHINHQEAAKSNTNLVPVSHQAVSQTSMKIDHDINHQKSGKSTTNLVPVNRQVVSQTSTKTDHINCQFPTNSESENRQTANPSYQDIRIGIPRSMSLGSFTVAQLAQLDVVAAEKTQPKYNAGVLQGNWFSERLQPEYRPLNPPPLNTCRYRSTYKDAFINYNLKDFSSVVPVKKDNSLPAWIVPEDDGKKVRSARARRHDQRRGMRVPAAGEVPATKDPHKGDDPDPFKRRDQYKTGYEYTLDAFQENPRLWDKYRGREGYFGRKKRNGCGRAGDSGQPGDGLVVGAGDDPAWAQRGGNQAPGSLGADNTLARDMGRHDRPQAADMGHHDRPQAADMGHHDRPQAADTGHYDRTQAADMGRHDRPQAPDMGRHDRPQAADMGHHDRPQAADMGRYDRPQAADMGRHDRPQAPDMGRQDRPQAPDMGRYDRRQAADMGHHDRPQAADMGHHDRSQAADMGRQDRPQAADMGHHDRPQAAKMGHHDRPQAPDMGRHDRPQAADMSRHDRPQAADMGHMDIRRRLEADLSKLTQTISTEYNTNFRPLDTNPGAFLANRREREHVFSSSRNISTFAF